MLPIRLILFGICFIFEYGFVYNNSVVLWNFKKWIYKNIQYYDIKKYLYSDR